jgi:hypothetical protein
MATCFIPGISKSFRSKPSGSNDPTVAPVMEFARIPRLR